MTTIDPHLATAGTAGDRADGVLSSLAAWITTSDHKKIGRLYIAASLLLLLAVGAIAGLLGIERIDATSDFIDSGAMPQLFSLYRVVLTTGIAGRIGRIGIGETITAMAIVPAPEARAGQR
jgi:cytochrome o ubiquinol oxidase subunit 1